MQCFVKLEIYEPTFECKKKSLLLNYGKIFICYYLKDVFLYSIIPGTLVWKLHKSCYDINANSTLKIASKTATENVENT